MATFCVRNGKLFLRLGKCAFFCCYCTYCSDYILLYQQLMQMSLVTVPVDAENNSGKCKKQMYSSRSRERAPRRRKSQRLIKEQPEYTEYNRGKSPEWELVLNPGSLQHRTGHLADDESPLHFKA